MGEELKGEGCREQGFVLLGVAILGASDQRFQD